MNLVDTPTESSRICRYIAEHGCLWEWKPGCDWATEEQLRRCEADGLISVRWAYPNAYYPWSTVRLTEAGEMLVGEQLFLEVLEVITLPGVH